MKEFMHKQFETPCPKMSAFQTQAPARSKVFSLCAETKFI